MVPFGAFVEVSDGFQDLVHPSELSSVPVVPEGVVQVDDQVVIVVTDIDNVRRRLSLSLRQA
ncbi:S1 RNA-binding domain-containing protein [Streptomyces sp. NPDC001443]